MCIALLLIYGLYCLLKDFLEWLGTKIASRQERTPKQKKTKTRGQEPLSMNELLTFEELLEDDE